MGLLNMFDKPAPTLLRLPSGSFTVDREGNILVSTLSSSFPADLVGLIAQTVLSVFREAAESQLTLSEVVVSYPSLKVTARELRGGAIVFLVPRTLSSNLNSSRK
jgi:hypothetical protein